MPEIRRLSDKEIESSPYPYILHLYYNGFMDYSARIGRLILFIQTLALYKSFTYLHTVETVYCIL